MPARTQKDVGAILQNSALVSAALAAGVREAMERHRRAGLPMAEWRDGKTVWIAPAEIERRIKELDKTSGKRRRPGKSSAGA